jgi:hypothetical protein
MAEEVMCREYTGTNKAVWYSKSSIFRKNSLTYLATWESKSKFFMLLEGIINFSALVVHICLRFIAEKFFTEIDLAQINHNKNYIWPPFNQNFMV